jgi:acetyl-CoA carboxylase/biotin carboxylase 1
MAITNGNPSANGATVTKHDLPSHFIGGNALESAPPSAVKDFVAAHEGHSVITSVSEKLKDWWKRKKKKNTGN